MRLHTRVGACSWQTEAPKRRIVQAAQHTQRLFKLHVALVRVGMGADAGTVNACNRVAQRMQARYPTQAMPSIFVGVMIMMQGANGEQLDCLSESDVLAL